MISPLAVSLRLAIELTHSPPPPGDHALRVVSDELGDVDGEESARKQQRREHRQVGGLLAQRAGDGDAQDAQQATEEKRVHSHALGRSGLLVAAGCSPETLALRMRSLWIRKRSGRRALQLVRFNWQT